MATLIATLGESPVVVTSTANILNGSGIKLDKIKVIYPSEATMIDLGVSLIEDTLDKKLHIPVEKIGIDVGDSNTTGSMNHFFWYLYGTLKESQENGEEVYISITGGRKGTSALGLLVAQLFPNVKEILHIIDKREEEEDVFYTIEQLFNMSEERRQEVMLPDPSTQNLIKLPFYSLTTDKNAFENVENALSNFPDIDKEAMNLLERVKLVKDNELTDYGEFIKNVLHNKTYPEIKHLYLSEEAKKILRKLSTNNAQLSVVTDNLNLFFNAAKVNNKSRVKKLFNKKIAGRERNIKVAKFFKGKGKGDPRNTVRIFFCTEGDSIYVLDIYFHKNSPLLNKFTNKNYDEKEKNDFHTLRVNIERGAYGRQRDFEDYKDLQFHAEAELIASLGLSPGIIVEAYAKLKERANIKKIYVIYPKENNKIYQNLSKIKGIIGKEMIQGVGLERLKDIDSSKAIIDFERTVSDLIRKIRFSHKIYMLISGGRKTMSASMLRVTNLRNKEDQVNIQAYHILVEGAKLENDINSAIKEKNKERLNSLLKSGEDKINLFMVPIDFGGKLAI